MNENNELNNNVESVNSTVVTPVTPVAPVTPEIPVTPVQQTIIAPETPVVVESKKPKKKISILAILFFLIIIALVAVMACIYMGYIKVPGIVLEKNVTACEKCEDKTEDAVSCPADNGDNSAAYVTFLTNKANTMRDIVGLTFSDSTSDRTVGYEFVLTKDKKIYALISEGNPSYSKYSVYFENFDEENSVSEHAGYKLPIENVIDMYNIVYGQCEFNYMLVLTADGKVYAINNSQGGEFATTEIKDLKNIVGMNTVMVPDSDYSYAIDINGNLIDLIEILDKSLSLEC